MKVGIDARFLTHPQHGGFKAYTNAVVSALVAAGGDHDYLLYTDRTCHCATDLPPNFTLRPASAANSVIREQVTLPLRIRKDGGALSHFLCNTAPVFCPGKLAVTIHDTIPFERRKSAAGMRQRLLNRYWRALIPRAARRADVVIAVSQHAASRISGRFPGTAEKIRVVPGAIDPVFFARPLLDAPPAGLVSQTEYLLGFASADGRKNGQGLMRAYRLVRKRYRDLKLVLVCATPGLRDDIEAAGEEGVAALTGVWQTDLAWLYRNARVFVFPSLDEGFGLPPLEAMASGTPVVSSDRGSLPEVLSDAALYTDPDSAESIADLTVRVLEDMSLGEELAVRGQARASCFTRERMAERLVRTYEDVAAGGQA